MTRQLVAVFGGLALVWSTVPSVAQQSDQTTKGSSKSSSFHGPTCIGGFCFDGTLLKEDALRTKFGDGNSVEGKFPYFCYRADEQKLFLRFRVYHGLPRTVLDVFVSDTPSCPNPSVPIAKFPRLDTAQGLKIGDLEARVIDLYGEPDKRAAANNVEMIPYPPSSSDSQPFGDLVWRYDRSSDPPLYAKIYLRDHHVSAILISRFP